MRGPLIGASVALLIGVAGAAAFYANTSDRPQPPAASPSAASSSPALTAAAEPTAPVPATQVAARTPAPAETPAAEAPAREASDSAGPRPSFDVVLVKPTGGVVAGRAAAGAEVTLEDSGAPLGKATADARGEWVITPERPLSAGEHRLALSATAPGAAAAARSAAPVVVVVPPPDATTPPVVTMPSATKAPTGGSGSSVAVAALPPVVGKTAEALPAGAAAAKPTLSVDAIGYDDAGRVVLTGRAEAGAELRIYLDDRFVAARTATDGSWKETLPDTLAAGVYHLRVDEVRGPGGKVVTRVALPFQRAAVGPALAADDLVIVQPGNSLWRIAKHSYGAGVRYAEIYGANRRQIADPDLIYPGQVFELPKR